MMDLETAPSRVFGEIDLDQDRLFIVVAPGNSPVVRSAFPPSLPPSLPPALPPSPFPILSTLRPVVRMARCLAHVLPPSLPPSLFRRP